MTFQESVSTCLTKYAEFSGRASRSEYWWFILAQLLAGILIGFILGFIGAGQSFVAIVNLLVTLGLLLPAIGVAIRRLHDTGRSGWWYLLIFIPIIGWILLIYWYVQPSMSGPNEYGNEPAA